jgi:hypothetical protein
LRSVSFIDEAFAIADGIQQIGEDLVVTRINLVDVFFDMIIGEWLTTASPNSFGIAVVRITTIKMYRRIGICVDDGGVFQSCGWNQALVDNQWPINTTEPHSQLMAEERRSLDNFASAESTPAAIHIQEFRTANKLTLALTLPMFPHVHKCLVCL